MCLAWIAAMPDGHPSAESDAESSSETVSSGDGTSADESVESVAVEEGPSASARPPPEPRGDPPRRDDWYDGDRDHSGKGGGKRSKGRGKNEGKSDTKCRHCWKKVKGGPAAMRQHEWWNESCLTWQYHKAGYDWTRAKRMAEALKKERMREGYVSGDSDSPEAYEVAKKKRKKAARTRAGCVVLLRMSRDGPRARTGTRRRRRRRSRIRTKRTRRRKDASPAAQPAAALSATSATSDAGRLPVTAQMARRRTEMGRASVTSHAPW